MCHLHFENYVKKRATQSNPDPIQLNKLQLQDPSGTKTSYKCLKSYLTSQQCINLIMLSKKRNFLGIFVIF